MKQATTIDEVIAILGDIITTEVAANSNLAFFPILYKKVTERIKEGIIQKEFEDNPRMERLDVIFANRYLEAYFTYKEGKKPSLSWENAFEVAKNQRLLILQHLLLGINAHINLDLGIAVSETMGPDGNLENIHADFNKINAILASMVDGVQQKIGRVSPFFYLLDKVADGKEDLIATFSINIARDEAWLFANEYHDATDKETVFSKRDTSIGDIAIKLSTTKSRILRWVIRFIRWFESKNVAKVADVLSS
ncbi:hypothetical protein GCM10011344_23960 [Dokdonia pacifica]|uniref:Uncharacterized protein n=1 Tax=Dokdonia pacifica TaxID=1627892 RepID=A0A238WMW3_9FLAO|nr:DUF5995 family protein [Dokdonia pacifica]GGG22397.1 hypothetical protein GCM10011344_23960 [Dokdonia pacifica]SNR47653.1 hypothetical protein SAMN06265376_1011227 [Dokdonia pacifica]